MTFRRRVPCWISASSALRPLGSTFLKPGVSVLACKGVREGFGYNRMQQSQRNPTFCPLSGVFSIVLCLPHARCPTPLPRLSPPCLYAVTSMSRWRLISCPAPSPVPGALGWTLSGRQLPHLKEPAITASLLPGKPHLQAWASVWVLLTPVVTLPGVPMPPAGSNPLLMMGVGPVAVSCPGLFSRGYKVMLSVQYSCPPCCWLAHYVSHLKPQGPGFDGGMVAFV